MAKKKKFIKKRINKDILSIEGILNASQLEGLVFEIEEDGLKDISSDIKELDGQLVKFCIQSVTDEDLTDIGFNDDITNE